MDNLMRRFPHLFEQTFCKLNNKSLFKSREVARSWKCFINERNYLWLCIVNIPTILKNSNTYLRLAAEKGQIDAFKTALSEEKQKDIKNVYAETSFHIACKNGHRNIVDFLLENIDLNVNINAKDDNSFTGFILACKEGHSNVAEVLMEKSVTLGIDLNVQGAGNPTSFRAGNVTGFKWTAFHWVCAEGHANLAKMIMDKSASLSIDLDAKDNRGRNAFHQACRLNRIDVV